MIYAAPFSLIFSVRTISLRNSSSGTKYTQPTTVVFSSPLFQIGAAMITLSLPLDLPIIGYVIVVLPSIAAL